MPTKSVSRDIVLDQSVRFTEDAMQYAITRIDKELGKGYAQNHPDFLGAFVSASMTAYSASIIATAIEKLGSGE